MTIENHDSTQMRPAFKLSGTWNVTEFEGGASQLSQIHQGARLAYMKASYERPSYDSVGQ
jgi:hypothetical protein